MREMDNGRTYHQRDRFLRDVVRAENHFAFFGHARRSVYFCLPRNTQQLKEDKDGWMIAVVTDDSNRRKETRNWVDSVVGCRTGRLLGLLYNVLLRKSHWQGGHFSLMLWDGSIWSSSSPLQRANRFRALVLRNSSSFLSIEISLPQRRIVSFRFYIISCFCCNVVDDDDDDVELQYLINLFEHRRGRDHDNG